MICGFEWKDGPCDVFGEVHECQVTVEHDEGVDTHRCECGDSLRCVYNEISHHEYRELGVKDGPERGDSEVPF